jgi:hypothetical protein
MAAHGGGYHAGGQGWRCADRERTGGSVAGIPGSAYGAFCLVDRCLGVTTERLACRRGPDAPRVPFDQRCPNLAFQSGNLP